MSAPSRRLRQVVRNLTSPSLPARQRPELGTLTIGDLSVEIKEPEDPSRIPLADDADSLDLGDAYTLQNVYWLLQKLQLGQDTFLIGPPGPYARRLAFTVCRVLNREYEHVALHRDVGETELKQSREIRESATLEFVDSACVRAAKRGSILIIDGIEKAERGILPILNNLLENREINLEDGTHIVHPSRAALIKSGKAEAEDGKTFIPAHKDFVVIALGVPVPPYQGYPLDPPFRSRFQARYIDPMSASISLAKLRKPKDSSAAALSEIVRNASTTVHLSHEMRQQMTAITTANEVPTFPQIAVTALQDVIAAFPPPSDLSKVSGDELATVLLAVHPALAQMKVQGWRSLAEAFKSAGLEINFESGSGSSSRHPQDGSGFLGYSLKNIEPAEAGKARLTFSRARDGTTVTVEARAGNRPFVPLPELEKVLPSLRATSRFQHLLTALLQLHAVGRDVLYAPPPSAGASSSSSLVTQAFAALLGYPLSTLHLYKELGGRELYMRRVIKDGGVTSWEPSPLVLGAESGALVKLSGLDYLGPTGAVLARLVGEREAELWEGKRLVNGEALSVKELPSNPSIIRVHPSFRLIATSSKSSEPKEWLTEELSSTFVTLPLIPMDHTEESGLLRSTGCPEAVASSLMSFARSYRAMSTSLGGGDGASAASKARRLGTGSLLKIAKRFSTFKDDNLYRVLWRTLLIDFLPPTTRGEVVELLKDCGLKPYTAHFHPPPEIKGVSLVFPAPSEPGHEGVATSIPIYDTAKDKDGAAHVPHMDAFYDNSQQSLLMRDVLTDVEVLKEHIVLLGNQGVGKNKIVDRALQLISRPREYIQLHRDTTSQGLMFQTVLQSGIISYVDSPLLRAVRLGRIIVVDEADKSSPHVVAILKSLAEQGEMTLPDGRRILPPHLPAEKDDIVVHPDFRMILLANRPGYPFLGNAFLQSLGDAFSCHAVANPGAASEERVLMQLAPKVDERLIRKLVRAFQDLRQGFEEGRLQYPYSLRELIQIVRHLNKYPEDPLELALRNVFDYDVHRPETIEILHRVLEKHGLPVDKVGLAAVREGAASPAVKKALDIQYKPKATDLSAPKYGKDTDKAHVGGNTWAGGTGGRDTAGLGGRGGFMRLFKGHDIHQVSDELKKDVPDEIKEKARQMAKEELARRLEEINMKPTENLIYSSYLDAVQAHVSQLHTFLENLAANEEERIWRKNQTDGELDVSRLTEGMTGESAIYKRRAYEKPELGRPQIKPKRIRFIFDLSASMYRFQGDGRLSRSLETAVMLLEAFGRLTKKEKYSVDIAGHSGEDARIILAETTSMANLPVVDRYRIVQKMALIPQFTFAGDFTLEAITKGVEDVGKADADDWFVITITDANFARYGITADNLKNAMVRDTKVKTALIAIGEGAESTWLPRALPGQAYRVADTTDIPVVIRSILGTMMSNKA